MVETKVKASAMTVGNVDDLLRAERGIVSVSANAVSLANIWPTMIGSWIIWVIIAAMNIATLTFLGLGRWRLIDC